MSQAGLKLEKRLKLGHAKFKFVITLVTKVVKVATYHFDVKFPLLKSRLSAPMFATAHAKESFEWVKSEFFGDAAMIVNK